MNKYKRVRFYCLDGDSAPLKWPPPGPFWCTGYNSDGKPWVVAYLKSDKQLLEFWPDAQDIDWMEESVDIKFSGRFPKPEWWDASNVSQTVKGE